MGGITVRISRANRVGIPEAILGRMVGLLAEEVSGRICRQIPSQMTRRVTGKFLIGGVLGRIFYGISLVISWKGFLEQSI